MYKLLSYSYIPNAQLLSRNAIQANLASLIRKISYYSSIFLVEFPEILDYDLVIYIVDNVLEHPEYLGHIDSSINTYRAITDTLEKPTLFVTYKSIKNLNLHGITKYNEKVLWGNSIIFKESLERYLKELNPEKIVIMFAPYGLKNSALNKYASILSSIKTVMKKLNHEPESN
mgnify:CR=1 FL=1